MNKQYFIFSLTTFLIVNYVKISNGQPAVSVGDSCVVTRTGVPGTCKKLPDCEQAKTEIVQNKVAPQICMFEGTTPIVCCVESEGSSQTSRPNSISRHTRSLPAQPSIPSQSGSSASSPSRVPGLISKEKCKEYAKFMEIESKEPPSEKVEKKQKCSFEIVKQLNFSDAGVIQADLHEFPHMALIGSDAPEGKVWYCVGSLISDRYVLTAAHCLYTRDYGKSKYVRLGINGKDGDYRQNFKIEKMFEHDGFEPPVRYNDIALLKLDSKVEMSPYVRPACLYTEKELVTEKGIASSWDKTLKTGSDNDEIFKITLNFVDHATCNESYKNHIGRRMRKGIIDDTQVCAGSESYSQDYCPRDSGGPIQIYSSEQELFCTYKIVGVASFGKYCMVMNNPTVYTRVSGYIKWIEDIVWPN